MTRQRLIIPISLIITLLASCVKEEKVIDKSVTIGSVEINGVKNDLQYLSCYSSSDTTFEISFFPHNFHVVKDKEFISFSFEYCRKDTSKQFLYKYSNDILLKHKLYALFDVSIGDESVADYNVDESDTANNYFQITHQENNFTTNMQGVFSVTFYKTLGTSAYPDTIKLRNGIINASGLTFPITP